MDLVPASNKNPLISIIINSRNGAKYLTQCLDSIYSQEYSNWEIIFYDNNSSDNTKEIINRYDNKINYYFSKKNLKLYDARNKALELCRGDLIAFLDSDDIWHKRRLIDQIKLYKKGHSIIYGMYYLIDYKGNIKENKRFYPSGKITSHIITKNPISIGTILILKKILLKYKFDPKLEILGDADLWLRLSLNFEFFNTYTLAKYYRLHDDMTSITYSENLINELIHIYRKNKLLLSYKYRILFNYVILKVRLKRFINNIF